MKKKTTTRRRFLRNTAARGAAAGIGACTLTSQSYAQVLGSNDRIRIGQIGCGGRNRWHTKWVKRASNKGSASVVAVCDIWRQKRESMTGYVKGVFGKKPTLYKDYRKLLESKQVDAVIIATPDHQHCGQLVHSVQAGKDVYIEKPVGRNMNELNKAYAAVAASKQVVQHGTQGRSSPGTASARRFVKSGKLGKLLRVESFYSLYQPYWNFYDNPEKESDTDWKAFLYNLPYRPFDADQHGAWMGYHCFSSGPVGGWMSHFSDFVHAVSGSSLPLSAVTQGGIYAHTSDRRRTAPDTVTALLEYPEGFVTSFTTHFGNGADNHTIFFFERGIMQTKFGHAPGAPLVSGEGSEHPKRLKEKKRLKSPMTQDHMQNWFECIRSRKRPNADMEAGYLQGVAVVMADIAYVKGKKMAFDTGSRKCAPASES